MRLPKYKTKFDYFRFELGKKSLPAKDDAYHIYISFITFITLLITFITSLITFITLLITFIFCWYIVPL